MGLMVRCDRCGEIFELGTGLMGQKGDLPEDVRKCPKCGGNLRGIGLWD